MKKPIFTRLVLATSGVLAALIGAGMVFVPNIFYESYHVLLPESASLRSELRGAGGFLLFCGGLVLAGAVRVSLRSTAFIVGGGLYGAFAMGRFISLVIDGIPSSAILAAWVVEVGMLVLIVSVGLITRKHERNQSATL